MSPHGTGDRYVNGRCRCRACRTAATRDRKVRRLVTRDQADPLTVSAVGSRRRLQALMTLGWSLPRLEQEAGARPWLFRQIVKRSRRVHRDKAALISSLYDELWNREPATETQLEAHSVSYTKTIARRNGYAPPMAWDDDTIDDPKAEPRANAVGEPTVDWVQIQRAMEGVYVRLSPAEKQAAARSLRRKGFMRTEAAQRLGMSGAQVKRIWEEEAA